MGLSLRKLFKAREKPGEDVQRVSTVEITDQQVRDAVTEICLRELAFWTCVGKIANALTKCEFRTFYEGVGMAKNGKIEYSDEYRFLEDERVYLIKLYAHGFALDNNAFQVLDIKDLQPLRFKVVSETEKTKTDDATLADLKIGALKLSPTFTAETTEYTATTQNASNTITAVPASSTAEIEITVGDVKVTNGAAANWSEGSNTVTVKATDGAQTKSYKVTVTKE